MTNTMTREELVWSAAQAHWEAKRYSTSREWKDLTAHEQIKATRHMDASLQAIEDAGCMVVPVEPTEAMLDRFVSRALQVSIGGEGGWSEYARNQYKTMVQASPMAKEG